MNRSRGQSLEALESDVSSGYPAVALQRRPRPAPRIPETPQPIARVLDIQQVPLTRPHDSRVSVLISSDSGSPLALGLVGHFIGLRNYLPPAHDGFREQVIEFTESDVYRRGQRRWFTCPGTSSPCGSKRMKLYLPPGERIFACADCHALAIPHAPDRSPRWKDKALRLEVLRWHEPQELQLKEGA